jgi:hypothetical protein
MKNWLLGAYLRIGMHAAPPGTLLHQIHALLRRVYRHRMYRYATADPAMRGRYGATRLYDIARLRRSRRVDGLALIFFMGAGDYLMATPLIRALRAAHPDLLLYAYASSHTDAVSSPLVIQLLQTNPMIDRVIPYRGRPRGSWLDYDFSDALASVPPAFVILPVVYETTPAVYHRVTAVLETFGLPVDFPIPVPITYATKLSPAAEAMAKTIRNRIEKTAPERVVCCHFGARSSGYEYPYADRLVGYLLRQGFLVVSFSPVDVENTQLVTIDVSTITPNDSIEILRGLKSERPELAMISVNSITWPISAALGIPNLGLHVFNDESVHQYLYPNLYLITNHVYPTVSPFRFFLVPDGAYQTRRSADRAIMFADYKPEFVIDSFETMASLLAR